MVSKAGLSWGRGQGDMGDRAEGCPGLRKQQAQVGSSHQWVLAQYSYMCQTRPRGLLMTSNSERASAALGHSPSVPQLLPATHQGSSG